MNTVQMFKLSLSFKYISNIYPIKKCKTCNAIFHQHIKETLLNIAQRSNKMFSDNVLHFFSQQ